MCKHSRTGARKVARPRLSGVQWMKEVAMVDSVREVAELLKTTKCLAWVGSGLSAPAGYANWDKTIRILAARCFGDEQRLDSYIARARHLDAAEKCKVKCRKEGTDHYHRVLAELFGQRVVTRRLAYELLIKLPFSGYITTNYDPLLQYEARGKDCGLVSYPGLPVEWSDGRPVCYIHGCARRDESPSGDQLVLAKSEYGKAYDDPGIVTAFLINKLASNHVLFMGTELTDPQLQEALRRVGRAIRQIKAAGQMADSPRYCFLCAAAGEQAMKSNASLLASLGIEEIFYYSKGDSRFSGLEDFLERLCREVDVDLPAPMPSLKSGIEAPLGVQ